MDIDVPDSPTHQLVDIDVPNSLVIRCHRGVGEAPEESEDFAPVAHPPAGQLSHDEWVRKNQAAFQGTRELGVASSEVIHPDGRVDQNHFTADRRRGGTANSGSLPPSRASRRADSRSTRARRPSLINAVRSLVPVSRSASLRRRSSRLTVVRTVSLLGRVYAPECTSNDVARHAAKKTGPDRGRQIR